jgi:hypothetical protein
VAQTLTSASLVMLSITVPMNDRKRPGHRHAIFLAKSALASVRSPMGHHFRVLAEDSQRAPVKQSPRVGIKGGDIQYIVQGELGY